MFPAKRLVFASLCLCEAIRPFSAPAMAQSSQANVHLTQSDTLFAAKNESLLFARRIQGLGSESDTSTPFSTASIKGSGWPRFASGNGNVAFLAAGTFLPLLSNSADGGQQTLRVADSLLTSTLITEALKTITHEKRPDGTDYKSFPSGHATAAFAVATMQAHFNPDQAIFWYAGAALIAASRVKLKRHYTHDVVAGAAVGILTSRLEIRQRRGLLLSPFISGTSGRQQQRRAGMSMVLSF
ncbi:phosphatase PAP2 family protein [bacterium]|nr:MAG: phosphatase PAP2 family protein [bacterium]